MKKYLFLFLSFLLVSVAQAQFKKLDTPVLQNGQKIPPRSVAASANKVNAITNINDTSTVNTVQNGSVVTTESGEVLIKTPNGFKNLDQVQSDWNATQGLGRILNKPNLGLYLKKDTLTQGFDFDDDDEFDAKITTYDDIDESTRYGLDYRTIPDEDGFFNHRGIGVSPDNIQLVSKNYYIEKQSSVTIGDDFITVNSANQLALLSPSGGISAENGKLGIFSSDSIVIGSRARYNPNVPRVFANNSLVDRQYVDSVANKLDSVANTKAQKNTILTTPTFTNGWYKIANINNSTGKATVRLTTNFDEFKFEFSKSAESSWISVLLKTGGTISSFDSIVVLTDGDLITSTVLVKFKNATIDNRGNFGFTMQVWDNNTTSWSYNPLIELTTLNSAAITHSETLSYSKIQDFYNGTDVNLNIANIQQVASPTAGKSAFTTSNNQLNWGNPSAQWTSDFYVSPTGNDNNAGTSISPFLTLDKAIAEANSRVGMRTGIIITGTTTTNRVNWNGTAPSVGSRHWFITGGHIQINVTIGLNALGQMLTFANIDISMSSNITRAFQVFHSNFTFWNGSWTFNANNQEIFYTTGSVQNTSYVVSFNSHSVVTNSFSGLKYVSSSNQSNPRYRLNFPTGSPNANVSTAWAETVVIGSSDVNGLNGTNIQNDSWQFGKNISIPTMPTYANDAAADADSALKSGQFYRLTGSRAVYIKP